MIDEEMWLEDDIYIEELGSLEDAEAVESLAETEGPAESVDDDTEATELVDDDTEA